MGMQADDFVAGWIGGEKTNVMKEPCVHIDWKAGRNFQSCIKPFA